VKLALSLAAALALPVSADDPTFRIGIACDGGLPMVIRIEATRPGVTDLTLPELMEFCAQERPQRMRWQGGA
jgi:hypothetical protein